MTKTLERPKKSASPKAQTPFDEQATGKPGWLGCSLWSSPVSYPDRLRCQRDVLDHEKAEGEKLVAEFRANEQLARDNDLNARQSELDNSMLNPFKKITSERRQELHKEMLSCAHQQYLIAESNLRELRESAADLAKGYSGKTRQILRR